MVKSETVQTGTETEKKTKRPRGTNKVDAVISSVEDAGKYLAAFRDKVQDADSAVRTYNHDGFLNLSYEDLDANGILNMMTCLADALGRRKETDKIKLASQIVAGAGRRQIEMNVANDYRRMAERQGFKDFDAFARKQTNGKTGKHFSSFNEMVSVAVEVEMSGEPAEATA